MEKRLIVNADDFGYSEEINKGIIEAIEFGLVKNTTIMLNRPGTDQAIEYVKKKNVSYGLHLNLDEFFYIDHELGKITDYKDPLVDLKLIEIKIRKEIEQMNNMGATVRHLDSHHHAHLLPGILPLVVKLCKEYNIKSIRFYKDVYMKYWNFDPEHMKRKIKEEGIKIVDYTIDGWFWGNLDLWQHGTAEIISHPGYNYTWREKELKVLTDRIVGEHVRRSGIEIISYFDL